MSLENLSRRRFCQGLLAVGAGGVLPARRARAAPEWIDQRQVGPFVCQASYPLGAQAALLAELPPLGLELERVLAVRPCTTSVYLYLLKDDQEHAAYIRERFPQVPYRRALFVKQDGQASVFAYRSSELGDDLRHECTHALLHADLPTVPLWLDEGIAEYFEVTKAERPRRHPHFARLKWDLPRGRVQSVAVLEKKERLEEMSALDYRSAWAWTHFMLHGPVEAYAELITFLQNIRNHATPGTLSRHLQRALPDLEQRFRSHFAPLLL